MSLAVRSLWQAPHLLNLAKAFKRSSVLFVDSFSFRYTEKLNHVSVGAMKDHKRIRVVSIMPMLAEIPQFVGCWRRRANGFRGYIWHVVHNVRDDGGTDLLVFLRIHVRPENWRHHI